MCFSLFWVFDLTDVFFKEGLCTVFMLVLCLWFAGIFFFPLRLIWLSATLAIGEQQQKLFRMGFPPFREGWLDVLVYIFIIVALRSC